MGGVCSTHRMDVKSSISLAKDKVNWRNFEHCYGDLDTVMSYKSFDQLIHYYFSRKSVAHGADSE